MKQEHQWPGLCTGCPTPYECYLYKCKGKGMFPHEWPFYPPTDRTGPQPPPVEVKKVTHAVYSPTKEVEPVDVAPVPKGWVCACGITFAPSRDKCDCKGTGK